MKIIVHTLATDDDNGTSSGAFATEDQMWDSLIEGTGKWSSYTRADADEWLEEQNDPDLTYHDWWEAHRSDMDSYTCDEVAIDFDLCAQPLPKTGSDQVREAIECLKRARDLLKALPPRSEDELTDEPVHVPGLNEALAPEWPVPVKGDA